MNKNYASENELITICNVIGNLLQDRDKNIFTKWDEV